METLNWEKPWGELFIIIRRLQELQELYAILRVGFNWKKKDPKVSFSWEEKVHLCLTGLCVY